MQNESPDPRRRIISDPSAISSLREHAGGIVAFATVLALLYFGRTVLIPFTLAVMLSLLIVVLPYLHVRPAIGATPAIIALYLYSLLPVVRNTYTGLTDVPLQVRESAEALGLSPWARLRLVELPMASRAILAGIKTAAVINVGFATLGGLIGAGGYGQPIITGLDKNDTALILEGAIPAVLMALAVQGLFEVAERFLVPRGLRLKPAE